MLEYLSANALHDSAADLFIDQLRVNDGATIFHAPMLQQLHEAGVDVDFEITSLNAVRESERPRARHIMARRHQLGLEAGGEGVGTEIGDARELVEGQALGAIVLVHDNAVANVEI